MSIHIAGASSVGSSALEAITKVMSLQERLAAQTAESSELDASSGEAGDVPGDVPGDEAVPTRFNPMMAQFVEWTFFGEEEETGIVPIETSI